VLVVGSVLLALLAAQTARFGTSLEGRPRHLGFEGGLTGDNTPRSIAYVSTVEVKADAAGESLGVVLAETGIGAGSAALGAVVAGLYALNQCGGVHRCGARVGLEHLFSVGHDASFL
jgi:hypothetical protein